MGGRPFPERALLFIATLYHGEDSFLRARKTLEDSFGPITMEGPPSPWDFSEYYREELGTPLLRGVLFFSVIDPSELPEIKLRTNEIERHLSSGGRRTVNLDPGYMTLAKVVLASTKNYAHRIYLGSGIYAEVTLVRRNGAYQPHLFTYPDFTSHPCRQLFESARNLLLPRASAKVSGRSDD